MRKDSQNLHWADEKEIINSNRPLIFLLKVMNLVPRWFIYLFVYPVSFFYFIFLVG